MFTIETALTCLTTCLSSVFIQQYLISHVRFALETQVCWVKRTLGRNNYVHGAFLSLILKQRDRNCEQKLPKEKKITQSGSEVGAVLRTCDNPPCQALWGIWKGGAICSQHFQLYSSLQAQYKVDTRKNREIHKLNFMVGTKVKKKILGLEKWLKSELVC